MKLIIAGSRDMIVSKEFIDGCLLCFHLPFISEFVSGKAKGIDACGEEYANWYNSPVKPFYADWDKFGRAAGPIRNAQMAEYADALLLIWDGQSSGSSNMRHLMISKEKPVYEFIIKKHNV